MGERARRPRISGASFAVYLNSGLLDGVEQYAFSTGLESVPRAIRELLVIALDEVEKATQEIEKAMVSDDAR